jgi:PEP-CTERM putative exosortase interaction domain/autotransporter-associated beta strand repeat
MITTPIPHKHAALVAALAAAFAGLSRAQNTLHWDGGSNGTNANWSTPASWNPNLADASEINGSDLVIATRNGTAPFPTSFLTGGDYTIRSITFDNAAGKFGSLHNVQNSTASSGAVDRVLTFATSGIDIITTSNFSSATTIRFRPFGTVTETGDDATFEIALNYSGYSAINAGANTKIEFESPLTGTGGITKTGSGTVYLNPGSTNTFSGGVVIAEGTLQVGRTGSLGTGAVQLGVAGGGDASLLSQRAGWNYSNDITVVSGAIGTLKIGNSSGTGNFNTTYSGAITVNGNLEVVSESAATFALRFTGVLSGTGDITKTGTSEWRVINPNNSWTGNLHVSEGSFTLEEEASLRFALGDEGATNSVSGAGVANFNGVFVIDSSGVGDDVGAWQLVEVDTLSATFGSSFTLRLLGEEATFANVGGGLFEFGNWSFDTTNGLLSLSAAPIPEPSALAALAGLGALGLASLRRRRG